MEIRLNKYLSDAGICSRREADRMAQKGRVTIDGRPAVPGQKIEEGQTVAVDGAPVTGRRRSDGSAAARQQRPRTGISG